MTRSALGMATMRAPSLSRVRFWLRIGPESKTTGSDQVSPPSVDLTMHASTAGWPWPPVRERRKATTISSSGYTTTLGPGPQYQVSSR